MNEDGLILLVLTAVLSIPAAIIYLLVKVSRLSRKVTDLEADLAAVGARAFERSPTRTVPSQTEGTAPPSDGPWAKSEPATAQPAAAPPDAAKVAATAPTVARPTPPPPAVSGPSTLSRAGDWLAANWFYVVAAASLALAGIFLIQYGVERGLLPPPVRVAAAVAFGAALILAGEYLRRRWGDGEDASTAYLPSVFSGAGVVTLFAAILGARHLYDLIGAGMSLTALSAVALGAIVLGWFHGPLLVAVGLIGGVVAPFAVGGSSDDVSALHGYFALLGLVGLAIDAVRRWPWRWVSGLAIATGMGGSILLWVAAGDDLAHLLAMFALVAGALTLPVRRLWPDHGGKMITETIAGRGGGRLHPETIHAGGAMAVASVMAVLVGLGAGAYWPALAVLVIYFGGLSLWADRARALQDVALVPLVGVFALAAHNVTADGNAITWTLVAAAVMSSLAFLRAIRGPSDTTEKVAWALASVAAAPAMGLLLHVVQDAPGQLGVYPWSLHALAIAGLLTVFAGVWAQRDGSDRLSTSLAALFAFTVIGYGIGQVAGEAALTVSIAAMAAIAVWLDRQFRLPLLAWFVVLAAPFTGWRLLAVPGWDWALDGPLGLVVLSFGGALAGFVAAWWWCRGRDRLSAEVTAETAVLSIAGLSLILFVWRGMNAMGLNAAHMTAGLTGTIWLMLTWVQLERRRRTAHLKRLRFGLAVVFGAFAAVCLVAAVTILVPLDDGFFAEPVRGPVVLNTLLPAYLVPAVMLMMFRHRWIRWAGVAMAGLWAVLTIRHFWNGASGMALNAGASQAEITSYTGLMLLVGGAAFYQGIASRSDLWRKAGLVVLGLTAAKVFLIDAASLTGLLRVGAFVALAFSLAGLAWLNRWAGDVAAPDGPETAGPDGPDRPNPGEGDAPEGEASRRDGAPLGDGPSSGHQDVDEAASADEADDSRDDGTDGQPAPSDDAEPEPRD